MFIQILYDQATNTLPAGFTAAMQRVVNYLDNEFTNNATMNLYVGNGEKNGSPIGAGFQAQNNADSASFFPYTTIRQDLVNAATSTDDLTSTQNMPTTDPISGTHDWWVTDLEQRALGINPLSPVTGYVGFEVADSSTYTDSQGHTAVDEWDYDRSDGITPDYVTGSGATAIYHHVWDFEGAALHELSELMGRTLGDGEDSFTTNTNGSNDGVPDYTMEDLFRFSSPGVHLYTGRGGYASPDNGTTALRFFNPTLNNADAADWDGTHGDDSFNSPVIRSGVINDMSQQDLRVMDMLGWTLGGDDYSSDTQFAGEVSAVPTGAQAFNYLVSGNINYATTGSTPGDHDWFRVLLTAGQSYRIDVNLGTLQESHLGLCNSSSFEFASDVTRHDGGTESLASRLFFTPAATGDYYVDVGGYLDSDTGTYTVSVVPDDYAASVDTTGTLAIDGSASGTIETSLDFDWFRTQLTAGRSYVFRMSGLQDTSIEFHDANGGNLGFSANALGSSTFFYRAVTTGTFYLDASANDAGTTGSYNLTATLKVADDLNGDGTSDVLWINPTNGTVGDWVMNNGTPSWQVVGQGSSTVNIQGYGDFTGNGTDDILWENPSNGLVGDWLMSNNQPTWQQIGQGSTTMNIAGVGDFNGDGTDDVLWQNPTNNFVGIWKMQNNVPAWEAIGYGSTTVNFAGVGDFAGSGKDDILWENPGNGIVGMWAINGSTPSWSQTWSQIGQGSTTMNIVGTGDFTGNGTDDILWENPTNGLVGFWGMTGGQATSWNVVATANTSYQVAGIGDYYSLGTDDILWRNPSTGDTGVWQMNNGQATWHDLGIASTTVNPVKA